MTDPAHLVQKYSARLNRKSGKDKCLIELPHVIQEVLIGFAEDLGGYYCSLGSTTEEREEALKRRIKDRLELRSEAFSAIQKALKDVRGYSHETINGKFSWIHSNKKAKRRRLDEEADCGRIVKDEEYPLGEDSGEDLNVET
ncbi:hypothetical protein ANCCAN_07745 [Ancylostoma caninum]|uniref:Uncharacterized protein n=1 Tax=Ancylostoma caninum TaxID=29170 RepID=A0A368GT34_ANCCA|nr:hypothetical protein ANCCAN_07745 [Ancylostoma caninum]